MKKTVIVGAVLSVLLLAAAVLGWRWVRMGPCREVLDECRALCARLGMRGQCMEDCAPEGYCYADDGKLITADYWFSLENMTSVLREDFEEYLEEEAYPDKIVFFEVSVAAETDASIAYAVEVTLDDEWGKEVNVTIRAEADKTKREYEWDFVTTELDKFSVGRMEVVIRPLVEELVGSDCEDRGEYHHRVAAFELSSGGHRDKWRLYEGMATASDNGAAKTVYLFHIEANTSTEEAAAVVIDRQVEGAEFRFHECTTTWSHPGGRERRERPVCVAAPEYAIANALVKTCATARGLADDCWEKAETTCRKQPYPCDP